MNNRKAFTVEANEELSERFSVQVEKRGYTKYRAIEGAIRLWLSLPNEVQSRLIENPPNNDIQKICEGLSIRLRSALHNALLLEKQAKKTPKGIDLKDRKSPK